MKEIFFELINESSSGKITIDGDNFNIAFNTKIIDNNNAIYNNILNDKYPTLIIKNQDMFFDKLSEYIDMQLLSGRKLPKFISDIEKNSIKLIIAFLFANATTEDFLNPVRFIERNLNYWHDSTFENLNNLRTQNILNNFMGSNLTINRTTQSVFMETPYKIDLKFINNYNNDTVYYNLPSISYGITEENNEKTCYIYSIINSKNKTIKTENQIKYEKKISREMYKLNEGVLENESDEYKKYKNNQLAYYPENISDVSPSAVIALSIFICLLEQENIKNIKVVPYLPIRYYSRELSIENIEDQNKAKELKERSTQLQNNITNKFLRTFRRVNYHSPNLKINSYPYEFDEYMHITLYHKNNINSPILEDIYDKVSETYINLNNKKL